MTFPNRSHQNDDFMPPVLRLLSTGGEWQWDIRDHGMEDEEYNKLDWNTRAKQQELDLLVQAGLQKAILEEKNAMDFPEVVDLVKSMQEEVTSVETRLARCVKLDEDKCREECRQVMEEKGYPSDVLITRTVNMEEVKKHIDEWKPALISEYKSLLDHGAIKPMSEEEFEALKREDKVTVEVLPALLVATQKPPKKLKARIVACGNFASAVGNSDIETAAGGVDNGTVRVLLSTSAHRGWSISTVDVRTAFLQAPRRATPGHVTVVQPPQVEMRKHCRATMKDGKKENSYHIEVVFFMIEVQIRGRPTESWPD